MPPALVIVFPFLVVAHLVRKLKADVRDSRRNNNDRANYRNYDLADRSEFFIDILYFNNNVLQNLFV